MEFKFDYIALSHVILTNTSFVNVHLVMADFYSRLIDSGRALYEFSFDSGGIDAYSDSVFLTLQFHAHGDQPLDSIALSKTS